MSEQRGLSTPNQPQRLPGVPETLSIISFEQFAGLQTKTPRISIQPSECAWLDGFMPVTDSNLRTLPGRADPIYTNHNGLSILFFTQFNFADQTYFFVVLSDGSCVQVNSQTGAVVGISGPGTLPTSNPHFYGAASWGGKYFLFSAAQTNGYFIWDGTSLYRASTLGPIVTVTNGGFNYISAPSVTAVGGSGSGATFSAQVQNGSVSLVTVTNPGSGYSLGNPIVLLFNGGNGTQTAYGTASFDNGVIVNVTLTNPGSGYQDTNGVQKPPTITVSDTTGSGAVIVASQTAGGSVISLKVVNGGTNYSNPTINFSAPTTAGTTAAATATVESGVITSVSVTQAGLGYTGDTSVTFFNEVGVGAQAQAILDHTTGSVTAINVTVGGSGYSGQTLCVVNGPGPAAATISLMPFGISGTAIEVFQNRVWIANGGATTFQNRVVFSASGDPANFNPGAGAGAFPSNDSFLRVGYHGLKQVNGFLYLIGDSSENTISGVQTSTPSGSSSSTSQIITTFNNQNTDPQLGSPWPASIQVLSRNIIFANALGIMVSYGGAVTKVSDPLDGFYAANIDTGPTANYPSAVATIYGTEVYMLLIPVRDPITDIVSNKLIMWNQKKFWTFPAADIMFVASQEINSVLTAWATNGISIFQLFAAPDDATIKTLRTKLWVDPTYWATKTAIRLSMVYQIQAIDPSDTIAITIDSETGSTAPYIMPAATTNPAIIGPIPIGQSGRCIGLTLRTAAEDISILSLSFATQIYTADI